MTPIEAYEDGKLAAKNGEFRATPGLRALTPEYKEWYRGYDKMTEQGWNASLTKGFRLRRGHTSCTGRVR